MTSPSLAAPRLSSRTDFGLETIEASAGTHVLLLSGELDMASAPLLSEELERLADAGGPNVVVDLARCTYVDSSGLRALARGLRELGETGGSLSVCCASRQLGRVFALSGLAEALGVCGGTAGGP